MTSMIHRYLSFGDWFILKKDTMNMKRESLIEVYKCIQPRVYKDGVPNTKDANGNEIFISEFEEVIGPLLIRK